MSVPEHLTKGEWEVLKMGYETVIPNWIMKRTDISPAAKIFGGFVRSVTHGDGWMSLKDEFITELTGLNQDQIIDAWSELNRHNMIEQNIYSKSRCIQLKKG